MRLLNTKSMQLEAFPSSSKPPYAILSHTWGADEVLFEDIQNKTALAKSGFLKIQGCCRQAVEDGFEWVWIDTCCIDKSSSAELSEAINSMFVWYQDSTVCYAYLQDIFYLLPGSSAGPRVFDRYEAAKKRLRSVHPCAFNHPARQKTVTQYSATDFTKSRWFTRGWTLQELIAPQSVEFYTAEWIKIGNKATFCESISGITRIPTDILRGKDLHTCNVAQRMSWASQRQTTRTEDIAYCLIGLFGVNMPLLYGEGRKSFTRLQEEIMKLEEDYSILAWSLQYDCGDELTGLLATSPADFSRNIPTELQLKDRNQFDNWVERFKESTGTFYAEPSSYNVLCEISYNSLRSHIPYRSLTVERLKLNPDDPPELTSRGLCLSLPVRTADDPRLPLAAWIYCEYGGGLLCVLLQQVGSSLLYARHSAPWPITLDMSVLDKLVLQKFYVHPTGLLTSASGWSGPLQTSPSVSQTWGRIKIITPDASKDYTTLTVAAYPSRNWSLNEFFFTAEQVVIGAVEFTCSNDSQDKAFVVVLGIYQSRSWCEILPNLEHLPPEVIYEKKNMELTSNHQYSSLLDMDVHCLDRNWCFSAYIHKVPSTDEQVSYALHVRGCSLDQQDPWVGLYLRERKMWTDRPHHHRSL